MYDIEKLLIIIISTIIPFIWVFKLKDLNSKVYFGMVVFFLFFYSGIGGALNGVYETYWLYYLGFAFMLSAGILISKGKTPYRIRVNTKFYLNLNEFLNKYADKIILVYLLLNLFTLIYPDFLIYRLIYPPLPDLRTHFAARFEEADSNLIQSILYYLIQITRPFFLFALFKYRKRYLILFLLLFSVPYITYCKNAYIGRGAMVLYIYMYIAIIYKYIPRLRKKIILIVSMLTPTFLIFLVNYSSIRQGGVASIESSTIAFENLLFNETYYPVWFSQLISQPFDVENILGYLHWLVSLPFPGFLKGDIGLKGSEISQILHGISPDEPGFYILLPGIVGESVFYFGKHLFWIHAFIMGFITGKVFNVLNKTNLLDVLLFYSAFEFSYMINRGGTASAYPFVFKHLIIFLIVIYLLSKFNLKSNAK